MLLHKPSKKSVNMKILLMGDASNYHASLAIGLRRLGHDVTVASAGSGWMNTARDLDISRPAGGKLGGALLYARLSTLLSGRISGFDVVQIAGPMFLHLKPSRNRAIFDRLRRHNGSVMLTSLAADSGYVSMSLADDCPLRYTEWKINGQDGPYRSARPDVESTWMSEELTDTCKYVYDNVDGAVCALYEYQLVCLRNMPAEKVAYGGIAIDTASIDCRPLKTAEDGKINIFLGRHADRKAEKGTDILERMARDVVASRPDRCRLTIVENLPYDEYLRTLRGAHLTLDQLYSYTPSTNALLPMAMGIPAVSGAEPEFYSFIGEDELRPIINADPLDYDATVADIRALVDAPAELRRLGLESRKFVERHNSCEVVAARFVDFWNRRAGRN